MEESTALITGSVPTFSKVAKQSKLEALSNILNKFPNLDAVDSIDDLMLRNAAKEHLIQDFPEEAIKRGFEVPELKPVVKQAKLKGPVSSSMFVDPEGVRDIDITPFTKKATTIETYTPQVVGESVPTVEKIGMKGLAKSAFKYLNPLGDIYNLLDPTLTANPANFKEEDVPGQPGRVSKGDIILPKLNNIVKPEDKDESQ